MEEVKKDKHSIGKLLFIGAIVTAGAIFLAKKFKSKFPNIGDDIITTNAKEL